MTFQEMIEDVQFELSRAEQKSPDRAMIVRRLNRAKDWLYHQLERRGGRDIFLQVSSVSVAAADTSINFPSGASRIVSLRQTDPEPTLDWRIVDIRRATEERCAGDPVLYVQGTTLKFANQDGAPYAATLDIVFTGPPADLTDTTASTQSFTYFPTEDHDLIVMKAASDLCDPTTELSGTLQARINERLASAERAANMRQITEPMRVRKMRNFRRVTIRRD